MNYYPTKEELIRDYFELNLMHQEIAEKYGYKTRQVIYRLFKKYNIKTKSKSELSKQIFSRRCKKPSKTELILLYEKYSISELSKIFKVVIISLRATPIYPTFHKISKSIWII